MEDTAGPVHIEGMATTPSGTPVLAPPAADTAADIRRRARVALTEAGLSVEGLRDRIPMPNSGWYTKIAAALSGEGRFTSLTLALFAEAVGVDVLWLVTGEQRPDVTIHACRVDESVGATAPVAAVT